jgi:hypothetical protein
MTLHRWLLGAGLAGAIFAPALACDPETMQSEVAAVCEAGLAEPAALLEGLRAHMTEAERGLIDRALAAARHACAEGDPHEGAAEAARIARLVGRIEARAGLAPPIWPERAAAR